MSDIVLRGYVQKRRGILSHLLEGRMTLNEYLVFDVLLLLADKETGSYMINATAVRFWTGEQLSKDAADKALRGLEEKGYIVREIVAGKKAVYPYHIQKFVVTSGAEVGTVLTFTKKANGVEKTGELFEYFGAEPADAATTESSVDSCYEIDTDEFVGTCPACAVDDPIFKALHPGRAGRGRVSDGSTANGVAAGTSSDDYKPEQRQEGCDDRH